MSGVPICSLTEKLRRGLPAQGKLFETKDCACCRRHFIAVDAQRGHTIAPLPCGQLQSRPIVLAAHSRQLMLHANMLCIVRVMLMLEAAALYYCSYGCTGTLSS